jgi:hypothetical protein
MKPQIRVSLEPHLREKLDPLIGILPPELQDELRQNLDSNTTARRPTSIPYDLLLQISQWSRSPAGNDILKAHQPPLSPNDYVMVSLLAGTTSSPEGKFGTYVPPPDPEQAAKRESAERKAILTLVNAVLSVAGAGFASFWAADKTGWKREYVRDLASCALALVHISFLPGLASTFRTASCYSRCLLGSCSISHLDIADGASQETQRHSTATTG